MWRWANRASRKGSTKVLDLFSGTGSVTRVFRRHGRDVTSLDRDMDADIRTDILDWDYRQYAPGSFDLIWTSPPCTEFSRAKTTGVRRIDEANLVVEKALEILDYLDPKVWVLKNPQTGLLKDQVFVVNLPFVDVDYCKYGMPYRKKQVVDKRGAADAVTTAVQLQLRLSRQKRAEAQGHCPESSERKRTGNQAQV